MVTLILLLLLLLLLLLSDNYVPGKLINGITQTHTQLNPQYNHMK